ncbi:hypothetical protein Acr_13g0012310 [Actinidia rufa]|uniref:WRC domain-containing protein n=1 Tax=Actinidia rufa TaxID=165716 RepID=A0A7J0FM85_9ERIC|nr:hypothetical protein Acr_13g0012310 [Actinidia rufa]
MKQREKPNPFPSGLCYSIQKIAHKTDTAVSNLQSFNQSRPLMRIRNRWPPPRLSPPPHDLPSLRLTSGEQRPSDLHFAAVSGTNGMDFKIKKQNDHCTSRGSNQVQRSLIFRYYTLFGNVCTLGRNKFNNHGVQTSTDNSISSSPSHEEGHWCEEDKVFPLKKRRTTFTSKVRVTSLMHKQQNERVSKTYDHKNGRGDRDDEPVEKHEAKRRESKGEMMREAWRCSRRNGRGWRCHRQALEGHSMCQHHLSQARLRNSRFNGVRSQNGPNIQPKEVCDSWYLEDEDSDGDSEMGFKKRGVLKARSMRSLLGQTLPSPPPLML